MTHPYSLAGGLVGLVHNGILSKFGGYNGNGLSDTLDFCRYVFAHRSAKNIMSPALMKHVAELIGPSSKFVLLDHLGHVAIVNEGQGHWKDGLWFSNENYKPRSYTSHGGGTGFQSSHGHVSTNTSVVVKEDSKDSKSKSKVKVRTKTPPMQFDVMRMRRLVQTRPTTWDRSDWNFFFQYHLVDDLTERAILRKALCETYVDRPPNVPFKDSEVEVIIENSAIEYFVENTNKSEGNDPCDFGVCE